MRRLLTSLTLAAILGTLGACSGASDDFGDQLDAMPTCEAVWVVGETLPADYSGCETGPDTVEAAVTVKCSSGADMAGHKGLTARLGGTIEAAESTPCR